MSYFIDKRLYALLTAALAAVWLVNGLLCKVLLLVPRHQLIVARILGETYAGPLTRAIGLAEIGMAVWVLSGIRRRLCVLVQIALVLTMNLLEFALASDLLLWQRLNLAFAALFGLGLYYYGFRLRPRPAVSA